MDECEERKGELKKKKKVYSKEAVITKLDGGETKHVLWDVLFAFLSYKGHPCTRLAVEMRLMISSGESRGVGVRGRRLRHTRGESEKASVRRSSGRTVQEKILSEGVCACVYVCV